MKQDYLAEVLTRADQLRAGEAALRALPAQPAALWRCVAALAALLAALAPSVSAALTMI